MTSWLSWREVVKSYKKFLLLLNPKNNEISMMTKSQKIEFAETVGRKSLQQWSLPINIIRLHMLYNCTSINGSIVNNKQNWVHYSGTLILVILRNYREIFWCCDISSAQYVMMSACDKHKFAIYSTLNEMTKTTTDTWNPSMHVTATFIRNVPYCQAYVSNHWLTLVPRLVE